MMHKKVDGAIRKMDQLNAFYNNVLTEQHNARMLDEKTSQRRYVNVERQKCKLQLKAETEKCKERHHVLKIREIARRKLINSKK